MYYREYFSNPAIVPLPVLPYHFQNMLRTVPDHIPAPSAPVHTVLSDILHIPIILLFLFQLSLSSSAYRNNNGFQVQTDICLSDSLQLPVLMFSYPYRTGFRLKVLHKPISSVHTFGHRHSVYGNVPVIQW